MSLPSRCTYIRATNDIGELARQAELFSRDIFDRVLRSLDGQNMADHLIDGESLAWTRIENRRAIHAPALGPGPGTVHRKGSSKTNSTGLEFHVKASDLTYGRVCVNDSATPTIQRFSIIPDDTTVTANPGAEIRTPTGSMTVNTIGAFDLILKRNAVEGLRLDGTGVLASKQVRFNTGLGAIDHILGPSDQPLRIVGNAQSVQIGRSAGETTVTVDDAQTTFDGIIYFTGISGTGQTGEFTHSNTAARAYAFPDASGTVWTSGNDGTGSGLDADLLDGQNSSAFQASDATLTALAGLATGANKVPYSTGTDTFSQYAINATPGATTVPVADGSGKLAAGWGGSASTLATLNASSKVVEDPANATTTATAAKIPIAGDGGKLDTAWIPKPVGHMSGLRLRYKSATEIYLESGSCRNSADTGDLSLAAEINFAITTVAAFGSTHGLDETTLVGTATTHAASATFEPSASIFAEAAMTRVVRNLTSGTITGAATTITGTGTKFLSELAVGDVLRSVSKGAARVTAIASDTSLTIAAAFPGGSPADEAGTLTVYENLTIQPNTAVAADKFRVNTITHAGTSVVMSAAISSGAGAGKTMKVGVEVASCWLCPTIVTDGTNTIAVMSTQFTKPYLATVTAWRRIAQHFNNSSGDLVIGKYVAQGHRRAFILDEAVRLVSNYQSATWAVLDANSVAPRNAVAILTSTVNTQANTESDAFIRALGSSGSGLNAGHLTTVATNVVTPLIIVPATGTAAQYEYRVSPAVASGGSYHDLIGYEWEA